MTSDKDPVGAADLLSPAAAVEGADVKEIDAGSIGSMHSLNGCLLISLLHTHIPHIHVHHAARTSAV